MSESQFEWDPYKNLYNAQKHGITFMAAQVAFLDPNRVILEDTKHSIKEKRYFCIGKIPEGILTVRFTHRANKIRIIGAGFWREGKKIYEKENH